MNDTVTEGSGYKIQVMLNQLGVPLDRGEIPALLQGKGPVADMKTEKVESVIGLPLKYLPGEILERYCDLSTPEFYIQILPYSEKLHERLISPLRSAKRCYCFGEFLATIELCSHIGEMLAQLVWQITPITHNQSPVTDKFETGLFGSTFEKLNQDRRIKVLRTLGVITTDQAKMLDDLRLKRVSYFHRWSAGTESSQSDAACCFKTALTLAKEIMQIGISPNERGTLVLNPLVASYLNKLASGE